jgi:sugar-specific transcriptional regulator TrmB
MVQPSKPIRYVALAPREALERTKQTLKKKHDEVVERIDRLMESELLKEMERLHEGGLSIVQPNELVGTLKGRYMIDRQLRYAFKGAKNYINIITTDQGLSDLYSKHFRILKKISRSGVKLRIAAPAKDNSATNAFSEIADIRTIPSPMGRMFIIDDENLMISLTDDKEVHETQDIAFWTNSSHAVKNMGIPLFEKAWSS